MKKAIKCQYFRTKAERHDYLGNRYFRLDFNSDVTLQICLSTGDIKRGKSNTFGMYLISRLTLFTNYLAPNYCEPCTKKEFDKQFELTIKLLK